MKRFFKFIAVFSVFVLIGMQLVGAKALVKATVRIISQPNKVLTVGDKGALKFYTPNYTKGVQYRIVLRDIDRNSQIDLYKVKDKFYTGIIKSGKNIFTLNYSFKTIGRYQFIVYVKKAGYKNYDSFIKSSVITVKEKVVEVKNDNVSDSETNNENTPGNNENSQGSENTQGSGTSGEVGGTEGNSGSGSVSENGGSTGGTAGTGDTGGTAGGTMPQQVGIVKSLNITLGNGNVLEGNVQGNYYSFDLKNLKDDDTVLKINFLLEKNATIDVAGKKFNAEANKVLSINLPSDLGMVDNPPPGITLASIRSYDSSFNLVFTINDGSKKTDVTVKLLVK